MQKITLPEKPIIIKQEGNFAVFEIRSCYPGYGSTIGNALRRVLLSSLVGSAITSVKIANASHEFSTIPGVIEDVVEIILNLKKIKFKMHTDEPVRLNLKTNKEGEVKASDIKVSSDVEIADKDVYIATVTGKNAKLDMEIKIEKGVGYMPIEQQSEDKLEIGNIAIDAIFTPVKKITYRVENMRVGKMTNYEKLIFEIETDGSITPEEAFKEATRLLVEHFNLFKELIDQKTKEEEKKIEAEEKELLEENKIAKKEIEKKEKEGKDQQQREDSEEILKTSVEDMGLSARISKILTENKIKTISKIIKKSEDDLRELSGMGDKGIKEIKKVLGKFGLTLKK
ncbi:MAG: DNA-directed RNA polymerase subunit alpha [Candidatus Pacebacteria bacterium]|nr:DNA-directed RNA polymerase subunit alpha [Candidatus Paceibacterota bacterium]